MEVLNVISLNEVCRILSISTATGRNWIKAGKLTPVPSHENLDENTQKSKKKKILFSRDEIQDLLNAMQSGEDPKLKNRRNKSCLNGFGIYKGYIDSIHSFSEIKGILDSCHLFLHDRNLTTLTLIDLHVIIAEYAIKLFLSAGKAYMKKTNDQHKTSNSVLSAYLHGNINLGVYECLIRDILSPISLEKISSIDARLGNALSHQLNHIQGQDILGLLYISLKSFSDRKGKGAYYTPIWVVRDALSNISNYEKHLSVIDPCCGSGNFLLAFSHWRKDASSLFGRDVDETAIQIARINMALSFDISTSKQVQFLYENFQVENVLLSCHDTVTYDVVIGNPPWGSSFSKEELSLLCPRFHTASSKKAESFSLFLEKALSLVTKEGQIIFLLPESFLSATTHAPIRKMLYEKTKIDTISFLENIFDGVQCPCILLSLLAGNRKAKKIQVKSGEKSFTITKKRDLSHGPWNLKVSDEEYDFLTAIENLSHAVYLKDNCDFALGIVTGDNKNLIEDKETPYAEVILKGSCIHPYYYQKGTYYTVFQPERFQQSAPMHFYRAPEKLIYRFISNRLIFAYDNKQILTLNSANILIPRIEGLSIKYILAVLNSKVMQQYYMKKYHSIKVLRSHLESLPIPFPSEEEQKEIVSLVDLILDHLREKNESNDQYVTKLTEQLDILMMQLYHISFIPDEFLSFELPKSR